METERTAVTVPALQQLKRDGMDLPWGCFRERIGHGRCRCRAGEPARHVAAARLRDGLRQRGKGSSERRRIIRSCDADGPRVPR